MKKVFLIDHSTVKPTASLFAKPLFTIFLSALLLLSAAPAQSSQGYPTYQQSLHSEIRYVDRSKGERNIAIPVYLPASETKTPVSKNSGHLFLWRIEHPDTASGIRSSYIFGTIHIDNAKVMALPNSLLHNLTSASTLMLELELNDGGSVDMLRKMLFTDGRNLSQVIGEASFRDVSIALSATGNHLPIDVLSVLKPWAAMLLLSKPENKSGTFLDKRLASLARNAGVQVQGLETISEQLSVFDDIAIEDQVSLLQATMDTLADKNQAFQQMINAYLSGDLNQLVSVSNQLQPKDQRLADLINNKLILERNQLMFDRMQENLQRGSTFIAIGALHLPGQEGLLEKLRNAGYKVSRVME